MVYDIAWQAGMVYGMARSGMAWYIVWPSGHGMVYDKAWRGMVCGNAYVNFMFYGIVLGYGHVEKPMSVGGPVHTYMYMTRSQVEGPLHACSVHMYSQVW